MLGSRRRQLARKGATAQALGWYQPDRAVRVMPNKAAWYDVSDLSSMRNNAGAVPSSGDGIKLLADKSGNSGVNVLALDRVSGNYASFPATAALGTGDFTVVAKFTASAITGVVQTIVAGADNSFALFFNATGFAGTSKVNVLNNTASTTQLAALVEYVVTYVRSSTTGTYYVNAATAGTTADAQNYTVGESLIGAHGTTFNLLFGGIVKQARIYNVALDAAGVLADYNGTVQSGCIVNVDFSLASKLATSFTATTGGTVTINTSGATGARISGARDLYQGTAANQPILTIAATGNYLTFDGSNDYLKAAAFSLSQPETVYFVGSQVSWTISDVIADGNGNSTMALIQSNVTPQFFLRASGAAAIQNGNLAVGTNGIITAQFNGASSLSRVNRTAAVTGDPGALAAGGFTLGARGDGAASWANITASEVLVRSVADGTPDQNRFALYAGRKWRIAV